MGPQIQIEQLQEALAKANGFLPAALPANRAGTLTPAQTQALEWKQSRTRRLFLLAGLVLAGIAAIGLWSQVMQDGLGSALSNGGIWLLFIFGLILVGVGLFSWEHQSDIAEGVVSAVEGRGSKTISPSGDGADTYYYGVGDRRFEVSYVGYEALVEGARYRAYYVPHSGALVNLEVLSLPTLYGPAPGCPICGRADRVHYPVMDPNALEEVRGAFSRVLPWAALFSLSGVSAEQAQTLQQRIQTVSMRLPPLATCQRDQVVFVSGAEKTVRFGEFIRMVARGDDVETIARRLGVAAY